MSNQVDFLQICIEVEILHNWQKFLTYCSVCVSFPDSTVGVRQLRQVI